MLPPVIRNEARIGPPAETRRGMRHTLSAYIKGCKKVRQHDRSGEVLSERSASAREREVDRHQQFERVGKFAGDRRQRLRAAERVHGLAVKQGEAGALRH